MVYSTTLHINAKWPHLVGLSNGIIFCVCHGKGAHTSTAMVYDVCLDNKQKNTAYATDHALSQ